MSVEKIKKETDDIVDIIDIIMATITDKKMKAKLRRMYLRGPDVTEWLK